MLVIAAALAAVSMASAAERSGTRGPDIIRGTPRPDHLRGLAGADLILGRGGFDLLRGGPGNDRLIGGAGKDRLIGGPGRDEFNTGPRGHVAGADGPDRIRARDGAQDLIQCGAGFDVALVDAVEDGVFDCERILEP